MPPEDQGAAPPATGGAGGATPAPGSGSGTAPVAGAPATPPPATDGEPLGEGGKAAIEAERRITREAQAALKAAQTELNNLKRAGMTELEAAQARVKELEEQTAGSVAREQERSVRVAAVEVAAGLHFRNPSIAWRLLDRSEIKYEEDGTTPKNVESLLKKIAEAEPYLVSGGSDFGGGNRGKTPGQTPSMDELLRAAARGG